MYEGIVVENIGLTSNIFILGIKTSKRIISKFKPGQFVKIRIGNNFDPLIPRPFTIHEVINDRFYILYQVVGKGTKIMSQFRKGMFLKFLGPLGKPFPNLKNYLICAGGVGIAGFIYLLSAGLKTSLYTLPLKILYGAKSVKDLVCYSYLKDLNLPLKIATEDGSCGYKGLVTDLLEEELKESPPGNVLACGPLPMLKKVVELCQTYKVKSYVSLETFMACGTGFCRGCVIPLKNGSYIHLCIDGPTVDGEEVDFEVFSQDC